jgi:hypothetical protein
VILVELRHRRADATGASYLLALSSWACVKPARPDKHAAAGDLIARVFVDGGFSPAESADAAFTTASARQDMGDTSEFSAAVVTIVTSHANSTRRTSSTRITIVDDQTTSINGITTTVTAAISTTPR